MKTQIVELKTNTEIQVTEDMLYVLQVAYFDNAKVGENKLSEDKLDDNKSNEPAHSLNLIFNKPGTSAEILALYTLKPGQSLNLTTQATHLAPQTSCLTNIRGVLYENTQSIYLGKIKIEKKAQQTNSFLSHNVLVLGENTKNRSDPVLEIEADDVKASHGSTTGRIDESQIYYLQSRGLTKPTAQGLIIEGFFETMLSKIPEEQIRAEVKSWLK